MSIWGLGIVCGKPKFFSCFCVLLLLFFFIADLSGGNLRTVGMKEAGDDGLHVTVIVGT